MNKKDFLHQLKHIAEKLVVLEEDIARLRKAHDGLFSYFVAEE